MHKLNDPDFRFDGHPRRFGKNNTRIINNKVSKFDPMSQAVATDNRFTTEFIEPVNDWRPFKLINDRARIAHTIHAKMGWTEIAREVLKDNTPPSSICALVRGRYKTTNGWRCEFLD
jgi:hypothetical protein